MSSLAWRADDAEASWPRALLTAGLLIGGALILYRDTAQAMVGIWARSDTFAHAFLVPPIVGWLIWRRRHALAAQVPRPAPWALVPVAMAAAAWLVGDLAASNAVAQLAFTALLVLVVVATIGPTASATIAFPLCFLFFSVPVGEFMLPRMMQWTADFTVSALRLTGMPVYREGLQFVVPSGNWSVVEACSGIRYLIASTMVGTLFAYLNYRTLWRRLVFVAVSIVVPVVANWVRAFLIVMLGEWSGNVAAVSADHLVYGWVFFGIVITVMFLIGVRWSEPESASRPAATTAAPATHARRAATRASTVAFGVGVLLVLPHLGMVATVRGERAGLPELTPAPVLGGDWRLAADGAPRWQPNFHGTAAQYNRDYLDGRDRVGLYVGYYRHQDYASKLGSSENKLVTLNDAGWSMIESGTREVATSDGRTIRLRSTLLRGADHIANDRAVRLLVWQVYWINGTLTPDETSARAWTAFNRLLGRGDDAAAIVMYADDDGGSSAESKLTSFVRANLQPLVAQMRRTRQSAPAAEPVP